MQATMNDQRPKKSSQGSKKSLRKLPGLKEARDNAALTVRDLGALAGVHWITIHHLEQGNSRARPSTVRKLANALGVTPKTLYTAPEKEDDD
jgi:DNA-binding XRE family transcriptional regulator